nr:choice-of-anchor B family protein [Woeseiaceae bacterium]
DYGTGLSLTGDTPNLIIAGSNRGGGSPRLYSLQNPASPSFVSQPGAGDYMHDAATMIIRDSRKDTQCVNAVDYCEVMFDFNESTIDIWDITDSTNPVRLSRTPYSNSAYTHSGWPTEDGMYLFVHDELDEQRFGLSTTVRTFSLADLRSPVAESVWAGPTLAIDHNGFVRGNRYYMSNYSRGLTILDISDPTLITPIALLDTYPFSDSASFVGAWGAYPYFHSGHVAVSDIDSGFYMVADDSRSTAQGSLQFTELSYGGDEGSTISVNVTRSGGTAGAVSVDYEIIPGTAQGSDVSSISGSLSWADGQSGSQTIDVTPLVDGTPESLEVMLLKLTAPTGGAALGNRSVAGVYVSDPGAGSVVEFDSDSIDVAERGFGTAVVTVQRRGSAVGSASVEYSLSNGDATENSDYAGSTTGTLVWGDGDALPRTLEFQITDDGRGEGDEFFELTLQSPTGTTIGTSATLRVNILDGSGSNSAPNAIAGSSQTVSSGSTVTLDGRSSNDPDGDTLSYQWSQISGTSVSLSGADTQTATFTAPSVSSDTLLTFRLEVSDAGGLSDTTTVNVTVRAPGASGGGGGGGGGFSYWLALLLALTALARSRHRLHGCGLRQRALSRRDAA